MVHRSRIVHQRRAVLTLVAGLIVLAAVTSAGERVDGTSLVAVVGGGAGVFGPVLARVEQDAPRAGDRLATAVETRRAATLAEERAMLLWLAPLAVLGFVASVWWLMPFALLTLGLASLGAALHLRRWESEHPGSLAVIELKLWHPRRYAWRAEWDAQVPADLAPPRVRQPILTTPWIGLWPSKDPDDYR